MLSTLRQQAKAARPRLLQSAKSVSSLCKDRKFHQQTCQQAILRYEYMKIETNKIKQKKKKSFSSCLPCIEIESLLWCLAKPEYCICCIMSSVASKRLGNNQKRGSKNLVLIEKNERKEIFASFLPPLPILHVLGPSLRIS